MLHVRLLIRDKRPGNYSIEGVFNQIITVLQGKVQFHEDVVSTSTGRFAALLKVRNSTNDINHITGDVHFLALSLPSDSTTITVHDVGHYEITLKGIRKKLYKLFWLKWPLSKAKYITCISEFTKNRLIEVVGIQPSRIRVIYNPAPRDFIFHPKILNQTKPKILQIGTGKTKNRIGLIKAAKGLNCTLIFIGELHSEHKQLLNDLKIEYLNPSHISQQDIYNYYKESDIVFFASFSEGFGLPIIEAYSVGRPVITSRCASMPEIAGDAAIFVDPHSPYEIRDAIERITSDVSLYEKMVNAGLNNIKRFDPSVIAEQYYQLYRTVKANHN